MWVQNDIIREYAPLRAFHFFQSCFLFSSVDPRLYLCLVEQQPATSSDQSGISFHHKYPIIVPGVQVIQTHIGA